MLTIYNVSRREDEFLRVDDSPYGVLPWGGYHRYTGQAFLQHEYPAITIFRADERAGVDCAHLLFQAENESEHNDLVVVEESDAIEELRKRANNMKNDLGIFGDQEKMVTNFFPAYDRELSFFQREDPSDYETQVSFVYTRNSRRGRRKIKRRSSMMSWIDSLHFGK